MGEIIGERHRGAGMLARLVGETEIPINHAGGSLATNARIVTGILKGMIAVLLDRIQRRASLQVGAARGEIADIR